MKRTRLALAALAIGWAALPAMAQTVMGQEGSEFIQAIRDGDDGKAGDLLTLHPNVVDFRDGNGDTALLIAIGRRDSQWTGYLINANADPNVQASNGDTPLIVASRVGFDTAVGWLLQNGARVDEHNKMGETPLIVAVQRREVPIIKMLLRAGADPDKTDTAAGYSARDYAKRDSRNPEILALIESTPARKAVSGPTR
jgi:ankyrin repeat protein